MIYSNRAGAIKDSHGDVVSEDVANCENCNELLVFAMKDKYHEFSLGLRTVLECLRVAETEGYVPKLPSDWWISVKNHY